MTVARLFQHAPKPQEAVVQAKARPPVKVSRSPRSARDPRFMRAVDLLQHTAARAPAPSAALEVMASPLREPNDLRFSSVLEVQRMAEGGGARVSSPHDPAEREAEAIARTVAVMPEPEMAPALQFEQEAEAMAPPPPRSEVLRKGAGPSRASHATMGEIAAAHPLGRPLPTSVRRFMEPRFRADFRGVRIHTGEHAERLSGRLNAQAFTVGDQIFFGRDRFHPDSHAGKELIAHELTHTIQQGAAPQRQAPVQRSAEPGVSSAVPPHVQRLGLSDAVDWVADKANAIPGFRMFTIVLGVNPINMSKVDRSAANILRAVVEFMPGGNLITRALDRYGVFDKVGSWIEGQLDSLGISPSSVKKSISDFISSLGVTDFARPGRTWDRAKALVSGFIDGVITFVENLAGQVLEFIKDAILRPLAELASATDGWDLLCAVLGKNPITGDKVDPSAENLIGGFMKLIGQTEIWENIKKSNAVAKAFAWFKTAVNGLMGFVREIPGLFLKALKSLVIGDLVDPLGAFAKVATIFGDFIGRFIDWAGGTIWDLLEIIFSVVAPSVLVYIKKAAAAFKTILQNPIGFVGNLIAAGKKGLGQFLGNFLKHLKAALIGWLTGSLSGAGVYIPQALTLLEIGKFVLSMLGITWEKIRGKIVKVIGEPAMKAIETGVDIVIALVKGGPAAAWDIIKQKLSDLKDLVIQSIIDFVKGKIVEIAITKLLSMLSPVGAFIQAIIGIYNTIMFFIERMKQIAAVAAAVIDSISAIANGIIAAAANKVEMTMAGLLTLVISFLARFAGLGKVSDAVVKFLKMVQGKVDKAIDFAIDFIVGKAKAFLKSIFGKDKKDERTDDKKRADVAKAVSDAEGLQNQQGATPAKIRAGLPAIKRNYKLTSIALTQVSGPTFHVDVSINPDGKTKDKSYKGKFSLGSDNFPGLDNTVIMAATTTRAAVVIHLWSKHGEKVKDEELIGRVEELRTTYQKERGDRINAKGTSIGTLSEDLGKAYAKGDNGLVMRTQNRIDEAKQQLADLKASSYTDVDSILEQLVKWKVPPGKIPDRATRFHTEDILRQTIREAIADNAKKIDDSFTNPDGTPKAVGDKCTVSKRFAQGIGIGYQLGADHKASRIQTPLNKVTVRLAISDSTGMKYLVETAYPEGG